MSARTFKVSFALDEKDVAYFRSLFRRARKSAAGVDSEGLGAFTASTWLVLLILPAGGLVVGLLTHYLAPEAEGHGTEQMVRAFHQLGGRVRRRVIALKAITSAITIGTGGSAGQEGPVAQVGSGVGSAISDALKLTERDRRIFLLSGASAGIGALFTAPLGGALFAPEVLYRKPDQATGLHDLLQHRDGNLEVPSPGRRRRDRDDHGRGRGSRVELQLQHPADGEHQPAVLPLITGRDNPTVCVSPSTSRRKRKSSAGRPLPIALVRPIGSTRSAFNTRRRKFCLCNLAPLSASATRCSCNSVNSPGNNSNTTGLYASLPRSRPSAVARMRR